MAEYQWAERNGKIVIADYNRKTDTVPTHSVMQELEQAFNSFGNNVTVQQADPEMKDVYKVTILNGDTQYDVFVCAKGTTPGGRNNLKDEQRIQPKSKYWNYTYEKLKAGEKAISLGIYKRDGEIIFCTWKLQFSNAASPETPLSKQIKIQSIARAMREGFVQQDKGRGEFACAFRKEFLYFYLNNSEWLHTGHSSQTNEACSEVSEKSSLYNSRLDISFKTNFVSKFERNRIIFGAPGTGKSYKLKEDCETLMKDTGGTYERVTFYPDYAYSHFVGTYKPVTDSSSEIKYEFVPGPFIRVYVEALRSGRTDNPQPHLLLIEEINRAKVTAVFGDIFQLLDRDDDGVSEYEIHASEDIRKYLARELGGEQDYYKMIRIPDNMFIWATMNSADQGVFPMDTAFKRRWNFEYLGIDDNDGNIKGKIILGKGTHEMEVEWNQLRKAINEKLAVEYKLNEDKLMGPYFLSKKIIETISDTDFTIADPDKFKNAFKNKVIMYLYEDAAKQHKRKLFNGCNTGDYTSAKYSSICEAFDELGIDIFGESFRELYKNQGV
ncbi:MAG: AAA domain-containing protein [Staphylococcus equorum]|nr:AAA domain-containing protein [Staphylococcus equorum]